MHSFSFLISLLVHVKGHGYRVTRGGCIAPLYLFMYPWTFRDIFLNLSLRRRRDSVPSFVPELLGFVPIASKPHGCAFSQGHSRVCPCPYRHFRDTGTFSGLSLKVRDIPEGHSRVCPSGLSLSLICPWFFFGYYLIVFYLKITIVFYPSSDSFFTNWFVFC